eukprot:6195400-Pleurochrysis_carterae.AAC.1
MGVWPDDSGAACSRCGWLWSPRHPDLLLPLRHWDHHQQGRHRQRRCCWTALLFPKWDGLCSMFAPPSTAAVKQHFSQAGITSFSHFKQRIRTTAIGLPKASVT